MKITRQTLRKIILQEMSRTRLPPHLDIEDAYDGGGTGSSGDAEVKRIVQNMVDEIEGSRGGLGTDEAAEELVRRLAAAGPGDIALLLAEMLLEDRLNSRSRQRRMSP